MAAPTRRVPIVLVAMPDEAERQAISQVLAATLESTVPSFTLNVKLAGPL